MHGYTNGTTLMANAFGTRDFDVPLSEVRDNRKPAFDVETALAAAHPGASVFDPFPALCDDESCWAVRDGRILYQDETHLSVEGSTALADGLAQAIRDGVAAGTTAGIHSSAPAAAVPGATAAGSSAPPQ
jgi:hypothetical protein